MDISINVDRPVRKGIILAGGRGTRLYPMTQYLNKHLLPVYDKPLIYYPLTTLMLSGVRDILVVSDGDGLRLIGQVLGTGEQWGLRISYQEQETPGGIAEGVLLAEDFISGDPFCLVLGDNFFYGRDFFNLLETASVSATQSKAVVFTQWVANPRSYAVLKADRSGKPLMLVEKPEDPPSNLAVTGLYFYDNRAVQIAKTLKPSGRGELEITDLNRVYMEAGDLEAVALGRGFVWFDAGTTQNLLLASELVEVIQTRQRTGIAFPEEVAYRLGFIDFPAFAALVNRMPASAYHGYLASLLAEFRGEDT